MNFSNTVILSLGSNEGSRLQNIELCVSHIHNEIGTVIKVSGLYETPSWGFESADFYNCAVLIHTGKTVNEVLAAIVKAEEALGRVRHVAESYQSRLIDVDIISFNEDIVDIDGLQVPHPRMQERNFVLYPLRDIAPQWIHPISGKNIEELIAETNDSAACKFISALSSPFDQLQLSGLQYIAIEGNIGAGKTTLAGRISQDFNAKLILERFADNPFLPKFYKDQARYAFSLEMSFLADRYQQLSDDLAQFDLFTDFVVADYHIVKSLIFSKITLSEDEYQLYRKLFDIIYKEMRKPGLYVYLYQDTETLLQHIKLRGRPYEQDIRAEYLASINQGYLDYIKSQPELNVLVIDMTNRDFVNNQQDYIGLLEEINEKAQQFKNMQPTK